MSIRTVEELSDRLAEDIIWRKKEFTVLRRLVESASRERAVVLVRAMVALAYAHWEGFVKNAGGGYLEFVRNRRLSYPILATNFVALGLRDRLGQAADRKDPSELIELIDVLREGTPARSRLPGEVETASNLSSEVLRALVLALGLTYEPYRGKEFVIDERLVRNRNRIAHGEFLVLDSGDAVELSFQIQELLELFRNQVENAAATAQYRR